MGGFGPEEGLWVGVMLIDEAGDIGFELADESVDAALNLVAAPSDLDVTFCNCKSKYSGLTVSDAARGLNLRLAAIEP